MIVSWLCMFLFRVDTLVSLKLQEMQYQLQISKEVSFLSFICLFVEKIDWSFKYSVHEWSLKLHVIIMTTSSLNEVCHNHHIGEVKHINNRWAWGMVPRLH